MDRMFRRKLLFEMQRIRTFEETVAERYAEQEMRCPVHLSIGQEAVAVGVSAALEANDQVVSTHRAHAHYLAKGGDMKAMLAEIYGRATGCAGGKGGSMHLVDLAANMIGSTPIVGGSLPVAVGVAFASALREDGKVTVVYFGEGATEEGVFAESINFAALMHLPMVFVCENNLYSVYSPMSVRQPEARDRVAIACAHGIAAEYGRGNDVEDVYRKARAGVDRVRHGQGPVFLEFDTYRWREHCGPNYDNHIGYRTAEEFEQWRERCPIAAYRSALEAEGVVTPEDWSSRNVVIRAEVDEAFDYARSSPFPSDGALTAHVYAGGTN